MVDEARIKIVLDEDEARRSVKALEDKKEEVEEAREEKKEKKEDESRRVKEPGEKGASTAAKQSNSLDKIRKGVQVAEAILAAASVGVPAQFGSAIGALEGLPNFPGKEAIIEAFETAQAEMSAQIAWLQATVPSVMSAAQQTRGVVNAQLALGRTPGAADTWATAQSLFSVTKAQKELELNLSSAITKESAKLLSEKATGDFAKALDYLGYR